LRVRTINPPDRCLLRPLHNASIRHSGLDPESRKYLTILDSGTCPGLRSGIRRNDKIAGFIQLCKGLLLFLI